MALPTLAGARAWSEGSSPDNYGDETVWLVARGQTEGYDLESAALLWGIEGFRTILHGSFPC
jgi:hypothetical protein